MVLDRRVLLEAHALESQKEMTRRAIDLDQLTIAAAHVEDRPLRAARRRCLARVLRQRAGPIAGLGRIELRDKVKGRTAVGGAPDHQTCARTWAEAAPVGHVEPSRLRRQRPAREGTGQVKHVPIRQRDEIVVVRTEGVVDLVRRRIEGTLHGRSWIGRTKVAAQDEASGRRPPAVDGREQPASPTCCRFGARRHDRRLCLAGEWPADPVDGNELLHVVDLQELLHAGWRGRGLRRAGGGVELLHVAW